MATRQQAEQIIQTVSQYLMQVAASGESNELYEQTVQEVQDILNEEE